MTLFQTYVLTWKNVECTKLINYLYCVRGYLFLFKPKKEKSKDHKKIMLI